MSFQKKYLLIPRHSNFADISFFFLQKISFFEGQNNTFTQSNSVRAFLEIF